jgi:hypothetical protein
MDNKKILTAFNNHFFEFVDDIINVFKNDNELLTARSMLLKLRKSNPKIIMKIYIQYVLDKYKNEIMNGDIDYFLNKDYTNDFEYMDNIVIEKFNTLKGPIKKMDEMNKNKVIKYMQNLIKLADLYKTI